MTKKGSGRKGILLSVSLLSGGIFLLAAQGWIQSFVSSDRFLVNEIELAWPKESAHPVERYRLHPPTSIFQADLQEVANLLRQRHPTAEVMVVRRILPNRLTATMRRKRAVAQVQTAFGFHPVDEAGRILLSALGAPLPHLPILSFSGLRRSYQPGQGIEHPSFQAACRLLNAVARQGGIAGHAVNSIRARGEDLLLLLDPGLEIRFRSDRLEAGWMRLAQMVRQKPDLLDQAQYIDLRFGDPVVGGRKKK